jgi:hypothetical protein
MAETTSNLSSCEGGESQEKKKARQQTVRFAASANLKKVREKAGKNNIVLDLIAKTYFSFFSSSKKGRG